MLIVLSDEHKDHLSFLTTVPSEGKERKKKLKKDFFFCIFFYFL